VFVLESTLELRDETKKENWNEYRDVYNQNKYSDRRDWSMG